jgi:hypothetical protein
MGAHLYRTPDDWYYSPVTTNGFSKPSDPHGGLFDYGFRTMASTPYGMFIGTANDYYGLQIFRATKRASPLVDSPGRLEIEGGRSGGALLSWLSAIRATSYRIMRAEILPILIRDDINVEGWNGVTGNKIPDTYITEYQPVGTTTDLFFVDSTVLPGHRYMYYVLGLTSTGFASEPSNLVTFPLLLPSITFAQLLSAVDSLAQRQRFVAPDMLGTQVRQQIQAAQTAAFGCQITAAINALNPSTASRAVLAPDSVDIGILIGKMIRRLQVYSRFSTQVLSADFCGGTP